MQREKLLTITEAARRFDVAEETLRRAAREGRLRAAKFGWAWMLNAADVGEWIAHGKHTPGPVPGARRRQPASDTPRSQSRTE